MNRECTLNMAWFNHIPIHMEAIYRSYILSHYCPLVWHFCGIQNSRNTEKIQERALWFIYEDCESTHDILLKRGNHDMLYIGRLRNMATEICKALKKG